MRVFAPYIFAVLIVCFRALAAKCYDRPPSYYSVLLEKYNFDYMVEEFKGKGEYQSQPELKSIQTFSAYLTPMIEQPLYGIYNVMNNTVVGVSLNATGLEEALNNVDNFHDRTSYIVTPINETMFFLGDGHMEKRSWPKIQSLVLSYVAIGVALKVATEFTRSRMMHAVYNGYIALGASPARFIVDLKNAITSSIDSKAALPTDRKII